MTNAHLEASLEGLSDEQLQAKLEEMQAALQKQLEKAGRQFTTTTKLSQERLNYAAHEHARVAGLKAQLEPFKTHPQGAKHYRAMDLLTQMYGAMKRMMEFQLFANEHNVALLRSDSLAENHVFRIPDEHPGYLEAKCGMDLAMALFYWHECGEGIDAVLRAAVGEKGLATRGPREEGAAKQRAEALKAAMASDAELAKTVRGMATELQELKALLEWGNHTLITATKLPDPAKLRPLSDGEWAKLNGKLTFLAGMGQAARRHPALAAHFPADSAVKLPYPIAPIGTGSIG